MAVQLETCHLGKIQGTQRTQRNHASAGSRPRPSEADKERQAQRQQFATNIHAYLRWNIEIDGLSTVQRNVLFSRYVLEQTQQEVARSLRVSQPRVSQIEVKALATLQKIFEEGL